MAAYNSEWYGKSIQHQKKILFIIMRAQRPQMITMGNGFLVASIMLFSQVIINQLIRNNKLFENYRFVRELGVHLVFYEQLLNVKI